MIMVQIGVKLFITPATELSILVCAKENKKDGIKIPTIPDSISLPKSDFDNPRNLVTAKGNTKKAAETTRRDPTSSAENTTSPFFIRMNDVPQMSARRHNNKMDAKSFFSDMLT